MTSSSAVDFQYRNILNRIMTEGDLKTDRTGVGTKAVWCETTRFNLAKKFPIVSLKTVYWKTAVKELLWFLSGSTNIRPLLLNNVSIWSDWPYKTYTLSDQYDGITMKEFENRIREDEQFAAKWGEIGPAYGK